MRMSAISWKCLVDIKHLETSIGRHGGWGVGGSVYKTSVLLASYKLIHTKSIWSTELKKEQCFLRITAECRLKLPDPAQSHTSRCLHFCRLQPCYMLPGCLASVAPCAKRSITSPRTNWRHVPLGTFFIQITTFGPMAFTGSWLYHNAKCIYSRLKSPHSH